MCLQEKQKKWVKNALGKLGFETIAKKCEKFKMEPIAAEKEDIKVGYLLK